MEIRRGIVKHGKRGVVSRFFHAKNDKDTIGAWRSDLNSVLLVFGVVLLSVHDHAEPLSACP